MSYSIIFETIIVKLADGRVLHLDRSGCNNDNAGRTRDDFKAKIYTVDEFLAMANGYKANSLPFSMGGEFELKVIGRYATLYDYGEHLLRMYRRAMSWEDTLNSRQFSRICFCEDVEVQLGCENPFTLTVQQFGDQFYKLLHSGKGLSYRHNWIPVDIHDERKVVELIENNASIYIYIGAKKRIRKY